jgi:hypothetical protein
MAAKKKDNDRDEELSESQEPERKPPGELPEGFTRANPLDGDRLFFVAEEGALLRGLLLGRFERRDKHGAYYYQIRLTEPCREVKTKDGEITQADIGEVVTIDERQGLRDLEPISRLDRADGDMEVFIRALEKVKLANGNTFWRWDVGSRRVPQGKRF